MTVFGASVCVIVKLVCSAADRSASQTLSFPVCECAFWRGQAIVGQQSEDPRSCWTEMIGSGRRWPLCDRWLGAGLAQPKSPTRTYVGSQSSAHTHTRSPKRERNAHTSTAMYARMSKHTRGELVLLISPRIQLQKGSRAQQWNNDT